MLMIQVAATSIDPHESFSQAFLGGGLVEMVWPCQVGSDDIWCQLVETRICATFYIREGGNAVK